MGFLEWGYPKMENHMKIDDLGVRGYPQIKNWRIFDSPSATWSKKLGQVESLAAMIHSFNEPNVRSSCLHTLVHNMGLSENRLNPYTQWLMIIIPTKWL